MNDKFDDTDLMNIPKWHKITNAKKQEFLNILNSMTPEQQDAVRFYGISCNCDGYDSGYYSAGGWNP